MSDSKGDDVPAIDFDLPCANCGADLRGESLHARCERCGSPIAETLNLTVIDTREMKVAADAMCVTCGYNLRTLPVASVCPECATPVLRSLRPDDLRFADPRYLRRLRRGVTFMLTAALGVVATAILWFVPVAAMSVGVGRVGRGFSLAGPLGWAFLAMAGLGVLIVLLVLWCIGVSLVTVHDPYPRAQPESRTAAHLARTCMLGGLLIWLGAKLASAYIIYVGAFAGAGSTGLSLRWPSTSVLMIYIVSHMGLLLCICAVVALAVYLRRLARRARQLGLAKLTTVLLWLAVVWAILLPGAAVLQALVFATFMPTAITTTVPATAPTTLPAGAAAITIGAAVSTTQYAPIAVGTSAPAIAAGQTGAGASAPAAAVVTVPPFVPPFVLHPFLYAIKDVFSCATMLIVLAVYLTGVIALLRYRRLFGAVLAGNAGRA